MKSIKKDLCENFKIRLPFFNVKPADVERLLKSQTLEIIATAICIPYLQKREQYSHHIPSCKTCNDIYSVFLKERAEESGLTKLDIDMDYFQILGRL